MGFLLISLLGCGSDAHLTVCPDTGCSLQDSDVSEDNGQNGEGVDFASFSSCDFSEYALPLSEDQANSTLKNLCPVYFRDDPYGTYAVGDTVQECQDSLDERVNNIGDAVLEYYAGEVSLVDILTCKVPLTVFYEYEPIIPDASNPQAKTEIARLYAVLGDERASMIPFEDGILQEPFPFPHFFFVSELEYVNADRIAYASAVHGIADLDLAPLVEETNDVALFSEPSDDPNYPRDLSVNEFEYATPCDSCDYTLVTSESALKNLDEDLTDTVKALLDIRDGETEIKRGAHFFPPEN